MVEDAVVDGAHVNAVVGDFKARQPLQTLGQVIFGFRPVNGVPLPVSAAERLGTAGHQAGDVEFRLGGFDFPALAARSFRHGHSGAQRQCEGREEGNCLPVHDRGQRFRLTVSEV